MDKVLKLIGSLFFTIPILFYYSNVDLYLIILLSVSFHELGHASVTLYLGHPFDLIFLPIGGKIKLLGKVNKIRNIDKLLFTLMGPYFTWILVVAAFLALRAGFSTQISSQILVVNMFLLIYNMAPIKVTDGAVVLNICSDFILDRATRHGVVREKTEVRIISWSISLIILLLTVNMLVSVYFNMLTFECSLLNQGFQSLLRSDLLFRLSGLDPFN